MNYQIEVKKKEDFPKAVFEVSVNDSGDEGTTHKVILSENYFEELSQGEVLPEELVEASFRFLLEREPNTAILAEFSLPQISQYFPEFEKNINSYF